MAYHIVEIEADWFGAHRNSNEYINIDLGWSKGRDGSSGSKSYQQYEAFAPTNNAWFGHYIDTSGVLDSYEFSRPSFGFDITPIIGQNILSAKIDVYSTTASSRDVTFILTYARPQFTSSNVYFTEPIAGVGSGMTLSERTSLAANTWETFTIVDAGLPYINKRTGLTPYFTVQGMTSNFDLVDTRTSTGIYYYFALDTGHIPLLTVTYGSARQIFMS